MRDIQVELAEIELPDFGHPTVEPAIEGPEYEVRLRAAWKRAMERGLDALLVYGDREHSANLAFLTGYDPRFEEALLILTEGSPPFLLVGNEGWGYSYISPVRLERRLYQPFSLMGQDRSKSDPLVKILREAGVREGARAGVIDWKYFGAEAGPTPELWLNAPAYLVDTLRQMTGQSPVNATDLLMNPRDGLRVVNSVDQLACFEFAATCVSNAMRRVIFGLRPGLSEFEIVEQARLNGLPLSCHPVLMSGPRVALGLSGPSSRRVQPGDPFIWAFGVWGALNARAGFLVHDETGLPNEIRDYVERLVKPYFAAIVEWYQHVGLGVKGGELYEIIHRRLGDPFFGVSLNPGHLIHLDEWVHSPIYPGSDIELRSGMALQVDVIPATGGPYFTTNIEDGIALADEGLRQVFAARWPEAWSRIQARRAFMRDRLGIQLKPEVLPFSNLAAYLPPYLLTPGRALRVSG
jgi:Xaa-Pro aminopeptidase